MEKVLISDEELKDRKSLLIKEKVSIQREIERLEQGADEWMELTEKTFRFAVYAKHEFETGDFMTKTKILAALGQNFILKDGKISIQLKKQYQLIEDGRKQILSENPRLELNSFVLDKTKTASFETVFATWSG